ncbi:hypothetical protein GF312_22505 [Candidatus Poribacteria bacterium]|nr:hypothetical protein [Candidatus Poribacteria bacterium]
MKICSISRKTIFLLCICFSFSITSFVSAELTNEELLSEIDSILETIESQADEFSRIGINGYTKIRIRNTNHSDTPDPVGPYGEPLIKGLKLNHRMIWELKARISEKLTTGGILRISNEDDVVFDTGPERFSNEFGSVFVRYNFRGFRWTLGYYDVHFTPLTLMRWDMDDNPEGGGTSRCAVCPSEGGAITAESLEELGPDFTFEGSRMDLNFWDNLNIAAIFARPKTAQERETYQQYLYATNIKLQSYYKPSTSLRWLGLKAIYITDDKNSVENPSRILYFPVDNQVYGVDFNFPLGKHLLLTGDFAYSSLLEKRIEDQGEEITGHALLITSLLKYPRKLTTSLSYIRISPKYKSIYSALSYSSNSHGFRLSWSYDIIEDKLSIWIFYKWLNEVESTIEDFPDLIENLSTGSVGITADLLRDLRLQTSYIHKTSTRDAEADIAAVDTLTRSLNVEIIYALAYESNVSFKYQHVRNKNKINNQLDHNANITSVLVSTKF